MSERSPQNQDKYVLRLPDGMRDRIKAAAEANNRSMNAEIVVTLEEKYPAVDGKLLMAKLEKLVRAVAHYQANKQPTGEVAKELEALAETLRSIMKKNLRDLTEEDLINMKYYLEGEE